jgi:hypothetical protein
MIVVCAFALAHSQVLRHEQAHSAQRVTATVDGMSSGINQATSKFFLSFWGDCYARCSLDRRDDRIFRRVNCLRTLL